MPLRDAGEAREGLLRLAIEHEDTSRVDFAERFVGGCEPLLLLRIFFVVEKWKLS